MRDPRIDAVARAHRLAPAQRDGARRLRVREVVRNLGFQLVGRRVAVDLGADSNSSASAGERSASTKPPHASTSKTRMVTMSFW